MKSYDDHVFLTLLKKQNIPFEYENGWLVVGRNYQTISIVNKKLKSLPPKIIFENKNHVWLYENDIKHLGSLIFNNDGDVNLNRNETIDYKYLEFNNNGYVQLTFNKLTEIDNMKFNNKGEVYLGENNIEKLPDNFIIGKNVHRIYFSRQGSKMEKLKLTIPNNIDEIYMKLDRETRDDFQKNFSNHWFFEKDRFNL